MELFIQERCFTLNNILSKPQTWKGSVTFCTTFYNEHTSTDCVEEGYSGVCEAIVFMSFTDEAMRVQSAIPFIALWLYLTYGL